jgi:cell fate regulator YaaT (PSP1 superfamily)
MTLLATVRAGKAKKLFDVDVGADAAGLKKGLHVLVRTERGTELATLVADPAERAEREAAPPADARAPAQFLRAADQDDVDRMNRIRETVEVDEFAFFREQVRTLGLAMRPVQVEHLLDGDKILFFFTSEERVDFRALARTLASRFQKRVELRRIPPREAAAMSCGVGVCGRELCCTSWLKVLKPVNVKMAKAQGRPVSGDANLGVCGRLRCCLRYELDGSGGCSGGGCSAH